MAEFLGAACGALLGYLALNAVRSAIKEGRRAWVCRWNGCYERPTYCDKHTKSLAFAEIAVMPRNRLGACPHDKDDRVGLPSGYYGTPASEWCKSCGAMNAYGGCGWQYPQVYSHAPECPRVL